MTRPGYNRRPALPCADSVALMRHTMPRDMIAIGLMISAEVANTPLGADDHQMRGGQSNGAGLELAATRLTTMRAARLGHYPTAADMDAVNDRDGEWGWAHVNNADPLPFKVVV